jgi:hypothetical protein
MKYNNAFTIAFEVISDTETGEDVTQEMFTVALLSRIASLVDSNDMLEAVGLAYDSYPLEDEI